MSKDTCNVHDNRCFRLDCLNYRACGVSLNAQMCGMLSYQWVQLLKYLAVCVCMFVCTCTKRLVVCLGRLVVLISSLLLSVPMLSPSPMQQGQVWKVCKVYHLPLINPAPSFRTLSTSPPSFVPPSPSPPGYLYWSVLLLLCGSSSLLSLRYQKQGLTPVPLGLNHSYWMQEISIHSHLIISQWNSKSGYWLPIFVFIGSIHHNNIIMYYFWTLYMDICFYISVYIITKLFHTNVR